jgi:alkylation response protein AidB-like acyl-CoA dehydrogenase
LDDVAVPEYYQLGRKDMGAAIFKVSMLWERTMMAAMHIGVMRRQLEESIEFVKRRQQFGVAIGNNQYVAGRVVDQLARYHASRLLVWDAAAKLSKGIITPAEASMTKLYVSESALASSIDAFRVQGAMGYMEGAMSPTDIRDSLGGIIYSGTTEMQKVIIASELGLGH